MRRIASLFAGALLALLLLTTMRPGAQAPAPTPSLAERLGFTASDIVLIVNADDVGMSHAANVATRNGMEKPARMVAMPSPASARARTGQSPHPALKQQATAPRQSPAFSLDGWNNRTVPLTVPAPPGYRYSVVTKRLLPEDETGNDRKFYGRVLDSAGQGLNNIELEMSWEGADPGTQFPRVTTPKDMTKPAGNYEFLHSPGTFMITCRRGRLAERGGG